MTYYYTEAPQADDNQTATVASSTNQTTPKTEKWYAILLQTVLPFLVAGFGMVAAGLVLDKIQHWEFFVQIPAFFTLYPALLDLKADLEMMLASRFSTQVNLGQMKKPSVVLHAVLGNFAVTICQSVIVGMLAALGAVLLKYTTGHAWEFHNDLVVIVGSVLTASIASLFLAGLMMFVILLAKKIKINPDNVATPIAAALGDLVTLVILGLVCNFLYQQRNFVYIHFAILLVLCIIVPLFVYYSHKNEFVKDALYHSWIPIMISMCIASTSGFIMGLFAQHYCDIVVFHPVVNGVGGNLVAIFASRLSTALHKSSINGSWASWAPKHWYSFLHHTFFSKSNPEAKTACLLALLAIPGHLIFFFAISQIKLAQSDPINPSTQTLIFVLLYIALLFLQAVLLMIFCNAIVHLTWRLGKNPDNVCFPYLASIGDLLGTVFLILCFCCLHLTGVPLFKCA